MDLKHSHLLVAIGSHHNSVCSVGAFARAEAVALRSIFKSVEILEPEQNNEGYPDIRNVSKSPDYIFFHAPSLFDRKKPWNILKSAMTLRLHFPRAKFVSVVHEFSEAPFHWKLRQAAVLAFSDYTIVNSTADLLHIQAWGKGLLPRKIAKIPLGPTLYLPELLRQKPDPEYLRSVRARARKEIEELFRSKFQITTLPGEKWILHPGLMTPGKGIDYLEALIPSFTENSRLIIMGGVGPKKRDREFASNVLAKLRTLLGSGLVVLESPSDDTFKAMLTASDLVLLPYENGLSERRSSFLSAMCCGASIWTTVGKFSAPMQIQDTGVYQVDVADLSRNLADVRSLTSILEEKEDLSFQRRIKNLAWARNQTWQLRSERVQKFISEVVGRTLETR